MGRRGSGDLKAGGDLKRRSLAGTLWPSWKDRVAADTSEAVWDDLCRTLRDL